MADIFQEVDEEIRKDKATELWKKYGGIVIGACLAIVVGTGANVGWREYKISLRQEESARFVDAAKLAVDGNTTEAIDSFRALSNEARTGYAVLAQLREAAERVKAGDRKGAITLYDAIAEANDHGPAITNLAQIMAVGLMMDESPAEDIEARLSVLDDGNSPWRFTAQEFRAMLAHRDGRIDAARELYKTLSEMAGVPEGLRQRSAQMLAILGEGS